MLLEMVGIGSERVRSVNGSEEGEVLLDMVGIGIERVRSGSVSETGLKCYWKWLELVLTGLEVVV